MRFRKAVLEQGMARIARGKKHPYVFVIFWYLLGRFWSIHVRHDYIGEKQVNRLFAIFR